MFRSNEPVKLNQLIACKLCEVVFEQPVEEVADWSERQKSPQSSSRPASASAKQSTPAKVKEPMGYKAFLVCSWIQTCSVCVCVCLSR